MALIVDIPNTAFAPLNGGTGLCFIEVIIGNSDATDLGLVAGETIFTDAALINRCIEVHRNNIHLPSIPWNSGQYFTKVYNESFFTFSQPLVTNELIKIKII